MREILPIAAEWLRAGRDVAIATVVAVAGSAPREIGASMAVSDRGEVAGNVSGGCVEGTVYERCGDALASGAASLERFGYADADGIAVGLTCGGSVEVLVRPVAAGSPAARDLLLLAEREREGVPTRFALSLGAERGAGLGAGLGVGRVLDAAEPEPLDGALILTFGTPARLVIVGAVEFAVALSRLGAAMGMRVVVVDPRDVFTTTARFPDAEVVVDWPDRWLAAQTLDARTAVCVLSHDPRVDGPALRVVLASPAGYVGAMGSRSTHDDRLARLRAAGVAEHALARLRSPIGLDLGGRSPEETALSILAEIVADRHGASGARLTHRRGAIHTPTPPAPARGIGAGATDVAAPASDRAAWS
ncbi:XdhC family protein [Microbacterium telephonicum]|uniref:Xanthine dehydrogenase accessory factor n=1 Tax=Microbacterium telephonicum TaxID=1714841 RepID=A0A498CJF6_9MICO|nr:XdhC/CoxI family protein [Microbacterium telephonicum]RLK52298.1 xanthine dehydrogenase accessory factor [Microbacterium telephonicum]